MLKTLSTNSLGRLSLQNLNFYLFVILLLRKFKICMYNIVKLCTNSISGK